MNDELEKLIEAGESGTVEFKTSFGVACIQTLAAFANTKGGTVLVGLNDEGVAVGVETSREMLQNWVNEIKQTTSPSIIPDVQTMTLDGKTVVFLQVDEFPVKPVACRDRYFRRVANSNHRLSLTEIANMHLQSLQLSWDSYPAPKASLASLDDRKTEDFIDRIRSGGRFSMSGENMAVLNKLGYITDSIPSHAAVLLFGKDAPPYSLHLGRFKTASTIIDDRMIRGTLFEVVDAAMKFIMSHIKVAFEIGDEIQRREIPEYPLPALRELLLNAVVHRDYTSPTDIQIKIFDDHITFFNPGKLYGGLTIEKLATDSYQSSTRNKLIAEAFYLTHDIEKYGSGFVRIREEIAAYPTMQFQYEESGDGFSARLHYVEQKITTTQETIQETTQERPLGEIQKDILKLLRREPKCTSQELAVTLNRGAATIKQHIAKLKAVGLLERIGSTKAGYWKVKGTTQETIQEAGQETTQEITLGDLQQKIMELLRKNPKYTRQELAIALKRSDATIKEHIANLKKLGLLERTGSTKAGFWKVKGPSE
jgi:ATP-dependent DNA helicase RecG